MPTTCTTRSAPTLRQTKDQVVKLDDHVGLHSGMRQLPASCAAQGQLAVVQGVGYPNPDRSHFESMDIWQSADPTRKIDDRLAGPQRQRAAQHHRRRPDPARRPATACRWPCQGATGGAVSVNDQAAASASSWAAATPTGRRRAASCSRTWRTPARRATTRRPAAVRAAPRGADADHARPPARKCSSGTTTASSPCLGPDGRPTAPTPCRRSCS